MLAVLLIKAGLSWMRWKGLWRLSCLGGRGLPLAWTLWWGLWMGSPQRTALSCSRYSAPQTPHWQFHRRDRNRNLMIPADYQRFWIVYQLR